MPGGLDQVEFAREVIAPDTQIHTDGALVLTRLTDQGFTHRPTPGYPRVTSTGSCPDRTWSPAAPTTTGTNSQTTRAQLHSSGYAVAAMCRVRSACSCSAFADGDPLLGTGVLIARRD